MNNECCGTCKTENLIGKKFGRLLVIGMDENRTADRRYKWICKCDCGNVTSKSGRLLKKGSVQSCGCINRREYDAKSRLYHIWVGMRHRCNSPKSDAYENYGGRGIKVCDEWNNDFAIFQSWAMKNGYNDSLTIERKNVDGNYEPSNCIWIPRSEQPKNTRSNHRVEINGESRTLAEWERVTGLSASTIGKRIKAGWSIEDALSKPSKRKRKT